MLRKISTNKWLQMFLVLMVFQSIACDCTFPKENVLGGRIIYQTPTDACKTSARESYILEFSCFEDYIIKGPSSIKCSEGEWTDYPPTCERKKCSSPPDIENAEYILKHGETQVSNNNLTIGSSAIYSCKDGYQLIDRNTSTLHCELYKKRKKGTWRGSMPVCKSMKCTNPPDIQNAEYILKHKKTEVSNNIHVGSSATYSCKDGRELSNRNESTLRCVSCKKCKRPQWKGRMPVCKEKQSCPDPGVSVNGKREGNCCFVGDTLLFSCNSDYELVGSKEIRCLPTGNWSSERPLCRPSSDYCELPPPIPHGSVKENTDGDYFRIEEEAEILCELGYVHRGFQKYLICEEGGKWEAEFGECLEIFCDAPDPVTNGTIPELLATNLTIFPYAFQITYICKEGYRLMGGDSWRICNESGWSGEKPYCEEIKCPDPGLPEYGNRKGESFGVGSKISFSCFPGFHLLGSVERYCMSNGQWSGELSRCDISSNYCPNPGIPIKGSKNSTRYDLGDKVGFRCLPGYDQTGSEVRECLPDKTWSGTETKCLGTYDFDNGAFVRDFLKARLVELEEEQAKELQQYEDASRGKALDVNFPGRIILYFAFDSSGSISTNNFRISIDFAKAIVRKVGISERGARSGAVTFGSRAVTAFLPANYNTTEGVLDALDRIEYTGGGTSTSAALKEIRKQHMPLVASLFGESKIKSVIFLLTDGKPNMGGHPRKEAEYLKKEGVEIYSIGITGDVRKKFLNDIASTSKNAYGEEKPNVFILQDYGTLAWLVQTITNGTTDYSQCGLATENVGKMYPEGRIYGGEESNGSWPWMAALFRKKTRSGNEYEFFCGGTIIHRHFILTAAHCLYLTNDERISEEHVRVKLGLTNLKNHTNLQEYEVTEIIVHPKYVKGPSYNFDIALIQLERPVEYNAFVRPICLPPKELPENSQLYAPEESAWSAGWGKTEKLKHSHHLRQVRLPIQSSEICLKASTFDKKNNNSHFTNNMICAGDGKGGKDSCDGDSGGPLMQFQFNKENYPFWIQVGIISWGESLGCGLKDTYGYYTHVQIFRTWIDENVSSSLKEMNKKETKETFRKQKL